MNPRLEMFMKKFKEKEFVEKIGFDKVARRRTNTSKKVANITATQIEEGVTLETLMELNVPVYRYQTQLTIHGKMPSLTTQRVAGYKSLVENGNGTIGVRYNAIDAQKKDILTRCYSNTTNTPYVNTNSTGTTLQKVYEDRKSCLEGLAKIPNVFIGQKYAGQDIYGRWFMIVEFLAIPEDNLWFFIEKVYGLKSIDELEKLELARHQKREAEKLERIAYQAEQRMIAESKLGDFIQDVKEGGYNTANIDWKGSGTYYVVRMDYVGVIRPMTFTLGKVGGKGQTKYQLGDTFDDSKSSTGLMKNFFKKRMLKLENKGLVFKKCHY